MASQSKILRFKIGEETFPVTLSEEELKSSPFSHTVVSALSQIDELYHSCDIKKEKSYEEIKDIIPNNIIAFLGDRGSGKTSCMRTVTSICKERHNDWLILDEIDPSFFDKIHNILDIFIGTLYGVFKDEMKGWKTLKRERQDQLRKINDDFRNVKSALRYIKEDVKFDNEYEIDELQHLNEGGKLHQLLNRLVSGLLAYKGKRFLLVSIDDLDLNISCSYEMLEQLRKYLILPDIAIMIAARYDQLFDNICLVLTRYYKDIPERVSQKDIAEMAERYLNKVLPLSSRCDMPLVESYMESVLLIDDEEYPQEKAFEMHVSVRVPDLIFRKTRYLFYNTSGIPSYVIPRNLRDLRMLVSMLIAMNDFSGQDHTNQDIFKNYFFKEWLGIIEPEYRPFVKRVLQEEDFAKINRSVVSNLYELFLKETEPLEKLKQEIREARKHNAVTSYTRKCELLYNIFNPRNSYWNVSVGDVVFVMNAVREIHNSGKTLALLFVLSTFYSFKLYETYNEMTDNTGEDGLKVMTEQPSTRPELKTSVRADIPSYFRVAGGSFFASSGDSFIPLSLNDRAHRETRIINARFLMPEIRSVVKEYKDLQKHNGKAAPASLKARLRLCEFFMLTVGERVDFKGAINRRIINEPLYFAPFGTSVKNLVFKALNPFFTSVYPKITYDRFHKDIYEIAFKEGDSIISRMRNHGKSRDKANKTWELMSKAAIRNMEILEDLTAWMSSRKSNIRPGNSGLLGALADFYYGFEIDEPDAGKMPVRGYCVKTYYKSNKTDAKAEDKKTDEATELPYYRIDYSIFSELGRFLREIDVEATDINLSDLQEDEIKTIRSIFDAIMSDDNIFILRDEYDKPEIREILYPFCGHSVVDFALGQDDGKISVSALSKVLAEITTEEGISFMERLPEELKYLYKNEVLANYHAKIEKLKADNADIDDKISDLKESVASRKEEIKVLKQESMQYKKDISKAEKEHNKVMGEIKAGNLDLLRHESQLPDDITKAQLSTLTKNKENLIKKLNGLEGKSEAIKADIVISRNHLSETSSQIESLTDGVRFFIREIKECEKSLARIDAECKRLEDNFNNPRLI